MKSETFRAYLGLATGKIKPFLQQSPFSLFHSLSILCDLNFYRNIRHRDVLRRTMAWKGYGLSNKIAKKSSNDRSLSKQIWSQHFHPTRQRRLPRTCENLHEVEPDPGSTRIDLKLLNIPSNFQCVVKFINCYLWTYIIVRWE